jgi:hypothetical protein
MSQSLALLHNGFRGNPFKCRKDEKPPEDVRIIEPVMDPFALLSSVFNKTGFFQYSKVKGDIRSYHVKARDDVAHTEFSPLQEFEYPKQVQDDILRQFINKHYLYLANFSPNL